MIIPSQFFSINANRTKAVKRNTIAPEKLDSSPDSAKQPQNAHVVLYDNREGTDRRKRKIKPLLCTRSGRDRRYDKKKPPINITA